MPDELPAPAPPITVPPPDDLVISPPARPAPAGPRIAHPALRLWAGAVTFLVLLGITYGLFVLTEPGQRLENLGLEGSALRAEATRADSTFGLATISVVSFGIAIVAVALVALLRRRPALAAAAVVTMGGSAVLGALLKDVLPRPELVEGPAWILRNSFPSGHATVAAAVGAGMLMVSPGRLRWVALPVAAIGAAVIGQATQVAGWHRASDAIGGMLLVLTVAAASLAVLAAGGFVEPDARGRVHPRIRVGLFASALVLLVAAALMGLLPLLFPLLRAPNGAEGVFVHLGLGLAGAGVTLLAFAGLGRLQEPLALGRRPVTTRRRRKRAGPGESTSPPAGMPGPGTRSLEPGGRPSAPGEGAAPGQGAAPDERPSAPGEGAAPGEASARS
jgi:membrane-associated phospholipid phosphatase